MSCIQSPEVGGAAKIGAPIQHVVVRISARAIPYRDKMLQMEITVGMTTTAELLFVLLTMWEYFITSKVCMSVLNLTHWQQF